MHSFPPLFHFKLETNLLNPVGSLDLISSESLSPLLCASSWGQNAQTQSDLGTNTITSRLKYFHYAEWRQWCSENSLDCYEEINSFRTAFLMFLVNGMWQNIYHIWFIFEISFSTLFFLPTNFGSRSDHLLQGCFGLRRLLRRESSFILKVRDRSAKKSLRTWGMQDRVCYFTNR